MSTKNVFIFLLALTSLAAHSQTDTNQRESAQLPNSIFISAGDATGLYSLNYERRFGLTDRSGLALGVGLSHTSWGMQYIEPRAAAHLKYFYRHKKHDFQFGAALCAFDYDISETFENNINNFYYAHFAQIAYKYSFSNERYFVSPAFLLLYLDGGDHYLMPWGALRLGVNF